MRKKSVCQLLNFNRKKFYDDAKRFLLKSCKIRQRKVTLFNPKIEFDENRIMKYMINLKKKEKKSELY